MWPFAATDARGAYGIQEYITGLIDAIEGARMLIGARNDNASEAVRQSNVNEAWHVLFDALARDAK